MYFLGFDVGSSSVKVSLFDADVGRSVARASHPDTEMAIDSPEPGWAEQRPESWWESVRTCTARVLADSGIAPGDVRGVGIAYQMHGLVLVDASGDVLRPSIIWCDSRAVNLGAEAFQALGRERCLSSLLNSPGNFTAAKLAWVRQNEPEVFARSSKFMLPGDYIAYRMTGEMATTLPGLSEAVLWDFSEQRPSEALLEYFGIPPSLVPDVVPTFGEQARLSESGADALGLRPGTPVSYRAGDQPNNALSLGVLEPGEIASTAGTSGVVYGVTDVVRADRESRVNSFAHVNHAHERSRLGLLLCINGAGSAYRWLGQLCETDYESLNLACGRVPVGADGLRVFPFGNGAERVLGNRELGASITRLAFNRHGADHVARAVVEGVAFAFRYGIDVMGELGLRPRVIRAGKSNMFQSSVFREALATVGGVAVELYRTDGAEGAARGAAIGAGFYASPSEAFASLSREGVVEPSATTAPLYERAYDSWLKELAGALG